MPRFKSINFYQNIPKIKLFLQKNANFFVYWGLRPQPPAAEGFAPRPSKHPPNTNFGLRAWYFYCYYVILCELILRLADVHGFPQATLSWNKFAHPWYIPFGEKRIQFDEKIGIHYLHHVYLQYFLIHCKVASQAKLFGLVVRLRLTKCRA